MADNLLKGISPKAIELAKKWGYDPLKVFGDTTRYIGLDGLLRTNAKSTIEANQALEPDFARGGSGGCNQDASKAKG